MSVSSSKVLNLPATESPAFGKYRLLAKLGQGGMADVFLALDAGPNGWKKLLVVKRLRPGIADDVEFHAMFIDEARLAARLNHPNVVQTYEVGTVDDQNYLCMEYLEGQALNRIVHRAEKQGVSSSMLAEYVRVVLDALTGLHYAHDLADFDGTPLAVVHRDVSPHNIFVTYDGVVKVVDFGIAKAATRRQETSTGVVKGKMSYMAPEQALATPVDRRADVFSMGAILWELVSGKRLWGQLSEVQILKKMTFGEVPSLKAAKSDVPEELERIITKALAMLPTERYESCAEMREELEKFAMSAGLLASNDKVGRAVTRMFEDRRAEVRAVVAEHMRGRRLPSIPEAVPPDVTGTGSSHKKEDKPREVGALAVKKADRETVPDVVSGDEPKREPTRTGLTASGPIRLQQARRRRVGWVVLSAAGAAVAVVAALVIARGNGQPAAEPARPATTGESAKAQIEVHIGATPAEARIFVDDVPASGNPFTARFAKDGTAHKIRVVASGFDTVERLVAFDKDQALDVALQATGAPQAATVQPAPTVAPSVAPNGKPLPGGRRKGPKVDSSNPWAP